MSQDSAVTLNKNLLALLPRSLWLQGLAMLGLALLLSSILVAPLAHSHFQDQLTNDLLKRGRTTVQTLEKHSDLRLAASLGDGTQALTLLQSMAAADDEITFLVLLGSTKNIIAFAPQTLVVPEINPAIQHQIGGESVQYDAEKNLYRFTQRISKTQDSLGDALAMGGPAPSATEDIGYVALGLSASALQQRVRGQTGAAVAGFTLILFNAFILLHMRWVAKRVYKMVDFAERMTAGDLTRELRDSIDDDLGLLARGLYKLSQRTIDVVKELRAASTQMSSSARDLLGAASSQSQNASTQAGSFAEMGATVSELRETSMQATSKAETVIDLARRSEESSSSGLVAVRDSVTEMTQVRDQVVSTSHTIKGLVQRTDQIDAIIGVVNDLAEQSNVLAINAGIEAAKAAEYGRGFSVVAREVRSLAERSKESTSQVKLILRDIQGAGRDAISAIEEGSRRAEGGTQVAKAAGDSIQSLSEAIAASSAAAMQIASSTRQQSLGVDQIWKATQEIDRIARETAGGIKQIESAATKLTSLASSLAGIVGNYNI